MMKNNSTKSKNKIPHTIRSEKIEKNKKIVDDDFSKQKIKKTENISNSNRIIYIVLSWIISLSLWLFLAYLLEFRGINTFLILWGASCLFHFVNTVIIIFIIIYFRGEKTFLKKGK